MRFDGTNLFRVEEFFEREIVPVHQRVDLLHPGCLHVHHELIEHFGGDTEVAELGIHTQGIYGGGRVGNAEFAEKYVAHDEADHLAVDFTNNRGVYVRVPVQDAGDLAFVVFAPRFFRSKGVNGNDGVQIPLAQYAHDSFLIRHFIPPCVVGSASGANS